MRSYAPPRTRSVPQPGQAKPEMAPPSKRFDSTAVPPKSNGAAALARDNAPVLQLMLQAGVPGPDYIRVGVSFRPDSRGTVHTGHDMAAIQAAGKIIYPRKRVEAVPLPRDASGADTPLREASWEDLADIDLIYIPGAPAANSTQIATSSDPVSKAEEEGFARPKKGFAEDEHMSRSAYEVRLIEMARTRGIPVLAICAGSWRLLEAYGGKVRTLPVGQREQHKAKRPEDTWKISHGVKIRKRTLLHDMIRHKGLSGTNSTHWAVAAETPGRRLVSSGREDPNRMIDVVARTAGLKPGVNTVEGFETRFGVPHVGVQWHPETNLPDMPGFGAASKEQRSAAAGLFKGMLGAAAASRARRTAVQELDRRFLGPRLKVALGLRSDEEGGKAYDEIAEQLGRPPTISDIREHLAYFNISDF